MRKLPKVSVSNLKTNNLHWPDDLVLLAESTEDVNTLVRCSKKNLGGFDLQINQSKSQHIVKANYRIIFFIDIPE